MKSSLIPRLGSVLLTLSIATSSARAQDVPKPPFEFESGESSLLVGTPHPALFSEFKIEGYDYLEASLTVEDKGAKVTWAPFLPPRGPERKYSFWSETRLQLSQKDDITSLGVSLQYNPLNPLSRNGGDKWDDYWSEVNKADLHSTFDLDLKDAKRLRRSTLKDRVIDELAANGSQGCSIETSTVETLRQDVLDARKDPAAGSLLSRIRCTLAELKDARRNLDAEIGELQYVGGSPDLLKQKKAQLQTWNKAFPVLLTAAERSYIKEREHEHGITTLMALRAEMTELDKSIAATTKSYAAKAYTGYRVKLHSTRIPVVNLSYINSFFNVIDGGEVDNDGDGLNDNEHRLKSRSLALSLDWRLGERDAVAFQLSRSTERSSAEQDAPAADYDGFAATWSHRLAILNKEGYTKTKDYKESLFVPSIVLGIAYESRDCDSPDADCAKGILSTRAVTPFVDFKIKKTAQFRIGIPFKRDRIFRAATGETDEDSIDIVSLVAFQLGAPK